MVIWFDVLTSFYRTLSVWHGAKLCVRLFYAVWRKSVISIRRRTLRGKAAGGERREVRGERREYYRFVAIDRKQDKQHTPEREKEKQLFLFWKKVKR